MSKHKILSTTVLILLLISLVSGNCPITVKAAPEKLPASPVDESVVPHYFGPYPNWGLSALTNPDVTVTIVGDGSGASATAKVGAGGAITDIDHKPWQQLYFRNRTDYWQALELLRRQL